MAIEQWPGWSRGASREEYRENGGGGGGNAESKENPENVNAQPTTID